MKRSRRARMVQSTAVRTSWAGARVAAVGFWHARATVVTGVLAARLEGILTEDAREA